MKIVWSLKLEIIQVENLGFVVQKHQKSLQKLVICEAYAVPWPYILPASEDTANIRVSHKKQGILIFLFNTVCNLVWKIWEEKLNLCLSMLPLPLAEKNLRN